MESAYSPPVPVTEVVAPPDATSELPFTFTGTAREYFSIWIVNILLTIVTIGIYSAWAKVRRLRYFYGHTALDGHHFAYHGEPMQILKGRIIAVGAFAIFAVCWNLLPDLRFPVLAVGLVLVPAVIVLSMSFNLRNTSLRNLRFAFVRNFAGAYGLLLAPLALALGLTAVLYGLIDEQSAFMQAMLASAREGGESVVKSDLIPNLFFLSLVPLTPWFDGARVRFLVDHARYGQLEGRYGGSIGGFYRLYATSFGMFMLVGFFVSLIIGGISAAGGGINADSGATSLLGPVLMTVGLLYAFGFVIFGYFQARRTNLIVDGSAFGTHTLHSRMRPAETAWIYFTNTVAAIVSLGLLLPWGKIRLLRYQFECTTLASPGLDAVFAGTREDGSALGEELVDAFDIDLGL